MKPTKAQKKKDLIGTYWVEETKDGNKKITRFFKELGMWVSVIEKNYET